MPQAPDVRAAGAVVIRNREQVLLVHRPSYDDWSFPKGKLDPGEHAITAAVREVAEETGIEIRLGPPLTPQRYSTGARMKIVRYWVGWATGDDDVSGYAVNDEIDEVAWLPYGKALERLTYPHDRDTLREARPLRRKTRALVVLRHAEAVPRRAWRADDPLRPLDRTGHEQAERLVPVLAAYDVARIVSSSSVRCVESVAPYASASGWRPEEYAALSEEEATTASVLGIVDDLWAGDESSVLCTHRPVLPTVFDALGVADPCLAPAGLMVVHHRNGTVLATELHQQV